MFLPPAEPHFFTAIGHVRQNEQLTLNNRDSEIRIIRFMDFWNYMWVSEEIRGTVYEYREPLNRRKS